MHIAIVAAYWHYPEVAYEFPLLLVEKGHEVTAILWNENAPNTTKHEVANGFAVYKVPGINPFIAISSRYPYMFGLSRVIDELRPEIIDCQSHLFLTSVQAVKVAKEFGIPSVVTVHGVMARRDHATNLAQYVYLYTLGSRTFRKVNLVRCLTKSDAEEIMRCGCPLEKIRIIPSAVDTDLFRPENKQAENLIAWVGRFVQEKGLRYLVEAARLVVDQHKDVKFMLVGDGSLRRKIVSMVDRNGLSENVIFAGKLAHKEIAKTLQKATLFVLPSLREGMPFALLEAMACGVAVVGSHIPGISNVVTHEENGLLVPPENPEALANAILMLLNDESLRRRLGQNARRLMVEKYSWNIITNKIEKLYHEVLM